MGLFHLGMSSFTVRSGGFFCTFFSKNDTPLICGEAAFVSIPIDFHPFTFTGKDPRKGWRTPFINNQCSEQRDEETGYSYHGARYYDPSVSGIWLSVDPMADKYPDFSPYAYCVWNPVKLVDPSGDTCKFANDEDEKYVRQLLDHDNKNYSPEFEEKFKTLDKAAHNYLFESWEGGKNEDGQFVPKNIDENTSTIRFTKGETADTRAEWTGMSEFKVLFEETYHAWKYEENNHYQYATCYSEALAWKFSSLAPGTKHFIDDKLNPTLMSHIFSSPPELLAYEFHIGFSGTYGGRSVPAIYPHLEIFPNNKFRMSIGYPEWK